MDPVSEKHDIEELRGLIEQHVESTGSVRGTEILKDFNSWVPKFKKILPHDYDKMLKSIAQMEERGMTREQAEVEAFWLSTKGDVG